MTRRGFESRFTSQVLIATSALSWLIVTTVMLAEEVRVRLGGHCSVCSRDIPIVLREVRKPPDAIPRCSEIPCRASPASFRYKSEGRV